MDLFIISTVQNLLNPLDIYLPHQYSHALKPYFYEDIFRTATGSQDALNTIDDLIQLF